MRRYIIIVRTIVSIHFSNGPLYLKEHLILGCISFLKISNLYTIIYIKNKKKYLLIKILAIMSVPIVESSKINLYNNFYTSLLLKSNQKDQTRRKNLNILSKHFINKGPKRGNSILFNFINLYLINFINFISNKKLFFCIKKLNYLTLRFKKTKTIRFMSRKLRKFYRCAGDFRFFKEFIDIM